ncbi:tyrosine-type recombinase/integrase, partial [Escherichia coli]
SLKTSIKTITYLSDIGCLEIQGASLGVDTRLLQDYLGHRNIQHTVRYTASNAARFKGVWKKKPR